MTEAERVADEIIEKHTTLCWECGGIDTAKVHALIHVKGIIEAMERASMSIPVFWQEVKRIIENK